MSRLLFHSIHNNSLIIFLIDYYVCHLVVVCNTPSVWPTGLTLAREYRYQHVLLYGSTCWLVARTSLNQSYFHLGTLSSVYGIRWRSCLTVLLLYVRVILKSYGRMTRNTFQRSWLAALHCCPWLNWPTGCFHIPVSSNFALSTFLGFYMEVYQLLVGS